MTSTIETFTSAFTGMRLARYSRLEILKLGGGGGGEGKSLYNGVVRYDKFSSAFVMSYNQCFLKSAKSVKLTKFSRANLQLFYWDCEDFFHKDHSNRKNNYDYGERTLFRDHPS